MTGHDLDLDAIRATNPVLASSSIPALCDEVESLRAKLMTGYPNGVTVDSPEAIAMIDDTTNTRCGRCAWCRRDHIPRRRGYELTCPHGYGCCQNCQDCSKEPKPYAKEPDRH